MTQRNRFWDAHSIQQGACNPSGIARSLVQAIDSARADGVDVRHDPAVRLIAHQLAFILNVAEYDSSGHAYNCAMTTCEARK